mmetsp:Transcript_13645/g.20537  ORF Transcript_13645/g.20537 Transcript_13645/m.20537 type:complete len:1245 (-) Transcript_13645:96-3830(-)
MKNNGKVTNRNKNMNYQYGDQKQRGAFQTFSPHHPQHAQQYYQPVPPQRMQMRHMYQGQPYYPQQAMQQQPIYRPVVPQQVAHTQPPSTSSSSKKRSVFKLNKNAKPFIPKKPVAPQKKKKTFQTFVPRGKARNMNQFGAEQIRQTQPKRMNEASNAVNKPASDLKNNLATKPTPKNDVKNNVVPVKARQPEIVKPTPHKPTVGPRSTAAAEIKRTQTAPPTLAKAGKAAFQNHSKTIPKSVQRVEAEKKPVKKVNKSEVQKVTKTAPTAGEKTPKKPENSAVQKDSKSSKAKPDQSKNAKDKKPVKVTDAKAKVKATPDSMPVSTKKKTQVNAPSANVKDTSAKTENAAPKPTAEKSDGKKGLTTEKAIVEKKASSVVQPKPQSKWRLADKKKKEATSEPMPETKISKDEAKKVPSTKSVPSAAQATVSSKPIITTKPSPNAPLLPQPKPQSKQTNTTEAPQLEQETPKPKPKEVKRRYQPPIPQPKPQPKTPQPKPQSEIETKAKAEASKDEKAKDVKAVESKSKPRPSGMRYQPPKRAVSEPEKTESEELKHVYDREVMLKYSKDNSSRPTDLPQVSDIKKRLNSAIKRQGSNRDSGGRRDNRRKPGGGRNRDGRRRNDRDNRDRGGRRKDERSMFLPPVEPLKKSENRFRVGMDKQEKTDELEKTEAAFRRVLNKICPENFDALNEKIIAGEYPDLKIDRYEKLESTAQLIFEKAIAEPVFCATYAQLCLRLWQGLGTFRKPDEKLRPNEKKEVDFRRVVLQRCQHEFEMYTSSSQKAKAETDDEKKAEISAKKRILGTIRLIGELFIRGMLTLNIIVVCCELLSKDVRPEFFEALCKLLQTIGKKLESMPSGEKYCSDLFKKLERISNDESALDFRHRFMIKDVIELRANRWIPRLKKTAAMTKQEFRKAVQQEELEAERRQRQGSKGFYRSARPQGSSSSSRRTKRISGDEWSTAGSSSRNRKSGSQDVRMQEKGGRKNRLSNKGSRGKLTMGQSNAFSNLATSRRPKPQPQQEKPSRSDKKSAPKPKPAPVNKPQLTDEEAQKKIDAFLDEYFDARSLAEVKLCQAELRTKKFNPKIVASCLKKSVEKKNARDPYGDVLVGLYKEKKLSADDIVSGYKTILADVADLSLDFPKISDFIGYIYGRLIKSGAVDMTFVKSKTFFEGDMFEFQETLKFAIGLFKAIKNLDGDEGLVDFYKKSGFDLKSVMHKRNASKDKTITYIRDRAKDLEALTAVITE